MYIVLEIQEEQDGTVRVLEPAYFEEQSRALQKYYTVLSYAVMSELAKHAAMIVTTDGQVFKSECYYYTPEPDPEPELEETEVTDEKMEGESEDEQE